LIGVSTDEHRAYGVDALFRIGCDLRRRPRTRYVDARTTAVTGFTEISHNPDSRADTNPVEIVQSSPSSKFSHFPFAVCLALAL
jgi:hypothetical protein